MVKVDIGGLPGGKPILEVESNSGEGTVIEKGVSVSRRGMKNTHLSWSSERPRLVITSDTTDFDPTTIEYFMEEGFQVVYLPYTGDKKEYHNKLQHLADPLDLGDKYAIVGT